MTREEMIIDAITNCNERIPDRIRWKVYCNSGFELSVEELDEFLKKIKVTLF